MAAVTHGAVRCSAWFGRCRAKPLAEQIIETDLAEHRPQCRLRELRRRIQVVLYVDNGPKRVHYAKVNDGVHFDADVVLCNDVLSGNVHCDRSKAYTDDAVDRPDHPDQTRTFGLTHQSPNPENHAAFVFAKDVQRIEQPDQNDHHRNEQ